MIMFERYMMADFITKQATENEKILLQITTEKESFDQTLEQITRWKEELDQTTTNFVARAMGLTIHTIQRDAQAPIQTIIPERSFGRADILYIPGHYQILVPKQHVSSLEELS